MASDSMSKVKRGDPLRFSATAYNAMIDAAQKIKAGVFDVYAEASPARPGGVVVRVRNNSGADRKRFEVLALSGPAFTPDAPGGAPIDNALGEVVLIGSTPSSSDPADATMGRFGILLDAVPAGQVARAMVAGVCWCRLEIPGDISSPAWGDYKPSSCTALKAAQRGGAQILWQGADAGGGLKWAVVRIGQAPPPRRLALFVVTLEEDGTGADGTSAVAATWKYKIKDKDTGAYLSASAFAVEAPRPFGQMSKATLGAAYYDAAGDLHLAQAFEAPTAYVCPS